MISWKALIVDCRGSVLIEASLCLMPLLLAIVLQCELVHRAQLEAVFHHAAFIYVRERALGLGVTRSRHDVQDLLGRSFGERAARSLAQKLDIDEVRDSRGLTARVHYRYSMLLPFALEHGRRHHLEMTVKCIFPL